MTSHRGFGRHLAQRLSTVSALTLLTGLALTVTAPAASAAEAAPDFAGTVALSNCSGSVVAPPSAAPEDPAFVMSNGHCLEDGFPGADEVIVDEPSSRTFELLDASGAEVGTLNAESLAYATMVDTDVALYQLTQSYAEISEEFGVEALPLSDARPAEGSDITVVSGYWKETYSCSIDGFVYELHEDDYVWKDSLRYTPECETIGGTSGSPVVDDASGEVVGVNNTGNEDGEECTMNNPCEVDEDGNVTVLPNNNYGQQSYLITSCVDEGNQLNLELSECELPKP